jgi:hypothetical protein
MGQQTTARPLTAEPTCHTANLAAETIASSLDLDLDLARCYGAKPDGLSQGRLAIIEQHFMTDSRGQYVVNLLKPSKLGLEVADAPLQAAYF